MKPALQYSVNSTCHSTDHSGFVALPCTDTDVSRKGWKKFIFKDVLIVLLLGLNEVLSLFGDLKSNFHLVNS